MIQVIKGVNASDDTVSRVLGMLGKTNPNETVNVNLEISVVDIQDDGVLIVWPDGRQQACAPAEVADNDA
jgi:hypothetical protein